MQERRVHLLASMKGCFSENSLNIQHDIVHITTVDMCDKTLHHLLAAEFKDCLTSPHRHIVITIIASFMLFYAKSLLGSMFEVPT